MVEMEVECTLNAQHWGHGERHGIDQAVINPAMNSLTSIDEQAVLSAGDWV